MMSSPANCRKGRKLRSPMNLSGHPSVQYFFSYDSILSFSWCSLISWSLLSVTGRLDMTTFTYWLISLSCCMSLLTSTGALDKTSAVTMFLPATWEMEYENLINLILWIRGGNLSKFFKPSSGTRGLWSVSTCKVIPTRKSEICSHAHVMANASFLFEHIFVLCWWVLWRHMLLDWVHCPAVSEVTLLQVHMRTVQQKPPYGIWCCRTPYLVMCSNLFWYHKMLSVVYLPMSTCALLSTNLREAVSSLPNVGGICQGDYYPQEPSTHIGRLFHTDNWFPFFQKLLWLQICQWSVPGAWHSLLRTPCKRVSWNACDSQTRPTRHPFGILLPLIPPGSEMFSFGNTLVQMIYWNTGGWSADSLDKEICQNPEFTSSFENTLVPSKSPSVCSTNGNMCCSLMTESFSFVRLTHMCTCFI